MLKPGLSDTLSRVTARVIGTAAGAWLISVVVAHFRPSAAELVLFTAIFAWLSYAVLNVNYALFTLSLTGYIVFLLALASIPEDVIAHRRAVCTLIGGVLLWPSGCW